MRSLKVIVLCLCTLICLASNAQDSLSHESDSIARAKAARKKLYSRPRRATIMSAILPGLGQAYNKKYWKLPIIYGGLAGFGYMFYKNNTEFIYFKKNVIAAYDNDPSTGYDLHYSPEQLQTQKLYYKKYRDFAIIGLGIIYIVNLVDANVDAHLRTFDVSDDLSLNVEPWCELMNIGSRVGTATGISLKFKFKQ